MANVITHTECPVAGRPVAANPIRVKAANPARRAPVGTHSQSYPQQSADTMYTADDMAVRYAIGSPR